MSGQPSDAALVAAARSGSDAAFARIVDRYQKPVRAFLWRVTGNEADADELGQEVFLSAWTRLATLQSGDRLKSWLFAIAWRASKARGRAMGRTRQRETDWQEERPDRTDRQADLHLAMQQALARLAPDQRAAVALCLAGGWTHADAARILDLPLGTVKSHVTRGRTRLMEILGVSDEH